MGAQKSCEVIPEEAALVDILPESHYGPITLLRYSSGLVARKTLVFQTVEDISRFRSYSTRLWQAANAIPALQRLTQTGVASKPIACTMPQLVVEFEYQPRTLRQILNDKNRIKCEALKRGHASRRSPEEEQSLSYSLVSDPSVSLLTPNERRRLKYVFMEREVLTFLDHLLSSLAVIVQLGRQFQRPYQDNLRPQTIVQNEDGSYMLINPDLMQLQGSYFTTLKSQGKVSGSSMYLSPEEWAALKTLESTPNCDNELSTMFSLGLVALEMCQLATSAEQHSLKDNELDCIYDHLSNTINTVALSRFLSSVSPYYSTRLICILRAMLEGDRTKRVTIFQAIPLVGQLLAEQSVRQRSQTFQQLSQDTIRKSKADHLPEFLNEISRRNYSNETTSKKHKHSRTENVGSDPYQVESTTTKQLQSSGIYELFMEEYRKIVDKRRRSHEARW